MLISNVLQSFSGKFLIINYVCKPNFEKEMNQDGDIDRVKDENQKMEKIYESHFSSQL